MKLEEIAVIIENKSQERKFISACRKIDVQRGKRISDSGYHYSFFGTLNGTTISFDTDSKEEIKKRNLFPITIREFMGDFVEGANNEEV